MADPMQTASEGMRLERDGPIRVERDGYVLLITLNNPERKNALSLEMRTTLEEVIVAAGTDPGVRVLVFTGAGSAFCSGGDVAQQKKAIGTPFEQRMSERRHWTPRQCGIYKPSICAVNGICAGAGLHFVSECDIVIASETAQFTDTHVNVGQIAGPDPIRMARRVPLGAVLRLAILGKAERLSAQRAYEVNLVSEVLAPERLLGRALELARILAEVSPAAVQGSLKLIWESFEPQLSSALNAAYETITRHRDHPDAQEGPRAFIEKRKPVWRDQ
jgi:enoyl-CoA hydratase/carnithine racemase